MQVNKNLTQRKTVHKQQVNRKTVVLKGYKEQLLISRAQDVFVTFPSKGHIRILSGVLVWV